MIMKDTWSGLNVCNTCNAATQQGDCGLCRACDSDFFDHATGLTGDALDAAAEAMTWAREAQRDVCHSCHGFGFIDKSPATDSQELEVCDCRDGIQHARTRMEAGLVPKRYLSCPPIVATSGFSAYLWGPTNTGKSSAAAGIAKSFANSNRSASILWSEYSAFMAQCKFAVKNDAKMPTRDACSVDLFVFDDVLSTATEKMTPFEFNMFWEVVSSRYDNQKPTIFTCRYRPKLLVTKMASLMALENAKSQLDIRFDDDKPWLHLGRRIVAITGKEAIYRVSIGPKGIVLDNAMGD